MPELRWTLAVIGALFIVALAIWEFRRQRQAPRHGANPGAQSADRVTPTMDAGDAPRIHREPTISLPELHPEPRLESRPSVRREPAQDPPIVEVDDASFSRLHVEGETDASEPMAHEADDDEFTARDADTVAMPVEDPRPSAPWAVAHTIPEPVSGAVQDAAWNSASGAGQGAATTAAPAGATLANDDAAGSGASLATHQPVGFATDPDPDEPHAAPPAKPEVHPAGASADGAPIVEWPREETRKIIALRLVSAPAARFPGRALRQALAAEGFVLGKFDIFHKAGPDERAVLSAASLSKPGTFAMNTIDAQRFGGISLFAVLPGPLPAQQTFDELLATARSLNDRLQGALQDERGEPLTPMRSASIRQSLCEGNGSDAGSQFETRQ
jgi:cell division protein ZipA